MTTMTLARETGRTRAIGAAGFAVALALASQIAVPLPGTPVPLTLQPLLVVLAGFWLGPTAAAASMVLYLTAGAAGLPVFAPMGLPGAARLLGPTGGYLLAYPIAAALAGWLFVRSGSFIGRFGAAAAGILMIYAGGTAQLIVLTGSASQALGLGVLPFVAMDVVKSLVAAALAPRRPDSAIA